MCTVPLTIFPVEVVQYWVRLWKTPGVTTLCSRFGLDSVQDTGKTGRPPHQIHGLQP